MPPLTALARVAAVVAAIAVTGCTAGPSDPRPTPDSSAAGSASASETTGTSDQPWDQARDDAEITIEETGFSNLEDDSGMQVTYAILLSNPSRDVAVGTSLEVSLLDAQGKVIKDKVADRKKTVLSANLVMPGEEQAISNRTYVDRRVDRVKITIADSHWAEDDGRFSELTVSKVRPVRDDDDLTVSFTVHSRYDETISPAEAYAILRDGDGKLLGGSAYINAEQHEYSPGRTATEIELDRTQPENVKDIEVYADPYVGELI